MDAASRAQANDMGEADLGILDLAVASFVTQVMTDFPNVGDASCGDGVTL